MKKISPAIALALLVFAAPAAAKEVLGAQLCGATGCAVVKDRQALAALQEGGPETDPPAEGSPWYRAMITVGAEDFEDTFPMVVVPSRHLMRSGEKVDGRYTWSPISGDAAKTIAAAAHPVVPFPASKLAGTGPPPPTPASVVEEDGGGVSAAWVGGAGAALLVGAGALGLRRRRRSGPA